MNALTITPAALHAALAEVEAIGRIQGTAAYAGGIAALRAMLGPAAPQATAQIDASDIADAVRFAEDHEACRMCGRVHHFEVIRRCDSGEPICLDCWPALIAETEDAAAKPVEAFHAGAPPMEGQPAHADSPPLADPPIDIPPLPAGPEDEGTHAPPGDASALSGTAETLRGPRAGSALARLTDAQKAALREMWPDRTLSGRVIRQRLTGMGGCPVNSDSRLYEIAKMLDLPRRTTLWAEQDSAHEVPRPASLSAEDQAEGDQNIRAGWTPAQLVDWFGITSPEAAAWHAGLRAVDALGTPAPESAVANEEPVTTQDSAAEPDDDAPPPEADPAPEAAPAPGLSFPQDPQGREVWEAFDSGMNVRDVGADFGIPLSTLTNTHALWQLARRKELS